MKSTSTNNTPMFIKLLSLVLLVAVGNGCAAVKPYERSILASGVMTADDPMESKLDGHVNEYREGSIGGTGVSGGGCGCN